MLEEFKGMELLVALRCVNKVAAGLYERSQKGEAYFERLRSFVEDLGMPLGLNFRVLSIDRPARRPSPRQLIHFEIMQSQLPSSESDFASGLRFLANLCDKLSLHQVTTHLAQSGPFHFTLIESVALSRLNLQHSLGTVRWFQTENRVEVNIGLEVLAVALARPGGIWHSLFCPVDLDIVATRRSSSDLLAVVREWLDGRGLRYSVNGAGSSAKGLHPCKLVLSDGPRPLLFKSGAEMHRFEEVANLEGLL